MAKKIFIALGLFLVLASLAGAAFLFATYNKIVVTSAVAPSPTPEVPKVDAFNNLQPYSLLLLGYGGGGHAGGKLTDTIMIVHIIPADKKVFLISLPRDLWVDLPAAEDKLSSWKINAAYAIGSDDKGYPHKPLQYTGPAGGGELSKFAVKQVTGIDIQNFASIDFFGFTKSIDTLKGIPIKVEKTFDDELYPIEGKEDDPCGKSPEEITQLTATMSASLVEKQFTCRYELLHFDAGKVIMDGQTALKYARSRHSAQDGGDFNRAARQRQVMLGIKEKVVSLDFFSKAIPFISTLGDHIRTDANATKMEEFIHYKDDLRTYSIHNIALSDQNVLKLSVSANGQSILVSKEGIGKWDSVHQWIQDEIKNVDILPPTATPSATTKKTK
jgi:anionic cell wall polymer biosynthesis LytR-Cps2A-Psr (LCP) family protein